MMLTDLLTGFARTGHRARNDRLARRVVWNRRPFVEPLENRRLLAITSTAVPAEPAELGTEVGVDIKPGDGATNPINIRSNGKVPVAILGSESFDITQIDVPSVRFGPCEASPAHRKPGHPEDVNGDGLMDLVVHFNQRDIGLSADDTEATLKGVLLGGSHFHGADSVVIKGTPNHEPHDPADPEPQTPVPEPPADQLPEVIDVKPRSNGKVVPINLRSRGSIPIAILSSENLDATQVDTATIALNGVSIGSVRVTPTDVDRDGDIDLLLHFRSREFKYLGILDADSHEIVLTAKLIGSESDGPDVVGSHPITIVPRRR